MIRHGATLTLLSRIGASAIVLICVVTLTGWLLQIPALASIVPGWPRIAPVVILCFLLCVTALFALNRPPERKTDRTRMIAASLYWPSALIFLSISS
jgi:hypothetical protein